MFPSFDFDAALEYLKILRKTWLYSRWGFLLDRHADKLFFRGPVRDQFLRHLPPGVAYLGGKSPGNRWVPTWRVMMLVIGKPILCLKCSEVVPSQTHEPAGRKMTARRIESYPGS
jgi:hypothetical protein